MKLEEQYVSGDWDHNLNDLQRHRASELVFALEENGCIGLRKDSSLCWTYIYCGKFLNDRYNSVDKIAKRMRKLEILYGLPDNQYINYKNDLLREYKKEYRNSGICISKKELHQIVEDEVESDLFQLNFY